MSNIATNSIVGKIFNPIVTTLSFEDLEEIYKRNDSLNVTNAVLFSIPKDSNTGEDIPLEGSIWLTDTDGYLYKMTPTFKRILEIESFIEKIGQLEQIFNSKNGKIVSIDWDTSTKSLEGTSVKNINPKSLFNNIKIKYINGEYELKSISSINNFKLNVYIDKERTIAASNNWYNNPGTYYIKGMVLSYLTLSGNNIETINTLKWTITNS